MNVANSPGKLFKKEKLISLKKKSLSNSNFDLNDPSYKFQVFNKRRDIILDNIKQLEDERKSHTKKGNTSVNTSINNNNNNNNINSNINNRNGHSIDNLKFLMNNKHKIEDNSLVNLLHEKDPDLNKIIRKESKISVINSVSFINQNLNPSLNPNSKIPVIINKNSFNRSINFNKTSASLNKVITSKMKENCHFKNKDINLNKNNIINESIKIIENNNKMIEGSSQTEKYNEHRKKNNQNGIKSPNKDSISITIGKRKIKLDSIYNVKTYPKVEIK